MEERLYSPSVRGVLRNPSVLHNLKQSAVPMFAPGNQRPPPALHRQQSEGAARAQSLQTPFFPPSTLSSLVLQSRCQRTACRAGVEAPGGDKVDGLCCWCIMTAIFQCDTCTVEGGGGVRGFRSFRHLPVPSDVSFPMCCVSCYEGLDLFPLVLKRVWRQRPWRGVHYCGRG